ncbi:putative alpha/beta hydrolase [Mumia flava]|uniref:Putative alpha/beta hydrolase n=1 Tax=Mumia flava TaxID=1348852 RepID=A0A0B2B6R8_9ACTN|nr:alpha/beta fold hydrolase [Mumia flava]PJJ57787.1 putative alpha/beta hydrolase [Mumia flava]
MTTVLNAVRIPTDDGSELSGEWLEPRGRRRGVLVVAPAMATPAAYYRPMAAWLRDRGIAVLLFDYRGYGASATGHLRDVEADTTRWLRDAAAAGSYALDRAEGLPVTWLGHSLGGQAFGLADHTRFARLVLVAAGSGHWRYGVGRSRFVAPVLWAALAPVAIRLTGYFPGRRFGIIGDLPPDVMREWASWCLHRDYLWGRRPELTARYAEVTTPVSSLVIADDELLGEASMRDLAGRYSGAETEVLRVEPTAHGLQRIGHHGFFHRDHAVLWESLLLPRITTAEPAATA